MRLTAILSIFRETCHWIVELAIQNWQRKLVALFLATILWVSIDRSLSTTKTFDGVVVKVVGVPKDQTVEGLESDGFLSHKISVTLTGRKSLLDKLSSSDLEIMIDASGHEGEWVEKISKQNLVPTSPAVNLSGGIDRVYAQNVTIRLSKLIQEKIPIYVSCIGSPPKPYTFLDVMPARLTTTIQGPSDVVRRYKQRGATLILNLSNISITKLESLEAKAKEHHRDIVTYSVPSEAKVIYLPLLSDQPITIDDPQAESLQINFLKNDLIQINFPIPLSLYTPPDYQPIIHPGKVAFALGGAVRMELGLKTLAYPGPIFVKGVSHLFVSTIRNMLELCVILPSRSQGSSELSWSCQLVNPALLEKRYIAAMNAAQERELEAFTPDLREQMLRHRFRVYASRLEVCDGAGNPLELFPELKGDLVQLSAKGSSESDFAG